MYTYEKIIEKISAARFFHPSHSQASHALKREGLQHGLSAAVFYLVQSIWLIAQTFLIKNLIIKVIMCCYFSKSVCPKRCNENNCKHTPITKRLTVCSLHLSMQIVFIWTAEVVTYSETVKNVLTVRVFFPFMKITILTLMNKMKKMK